jgi:Ner family transcriptional regulator
MSPEPWHRADIVAAVRKSGSTLRRLSIESGFAPSTLRASLERIHPRAHDIIASFVGKRRQDIWPNYYGEDGRRLPRAEQRRREILASKHRRTSE